MNKTSMPVWLIELHRQWQQIRGMKWRSYNRPFGRDWEDLLEAAGVERMLQSGREGLFEQEHHGKPDLQGWPFDSKSGQPLAGADTLF